MQALITEEAYDGGFIGIFCRNHLDSAEMVSAEPTISTIIHENSNTTTVLSAVATSESVSLIPHFARIEVIPAKNAESTAIISHMSVPFLSALSKTS